MDVTGPHSEKPMQRRDVVELPEPGHSRKDDIILRHFLENRYMLCTYCVPASVTPTLAIMGNNRYIVPALIGF